MLKRRFCIIQSIRNRLAVSAQSEICASCKRVIYCAHLAWSVAGIRVCMDVFVRARGCMSMCLQRSVFLPLPHLLMFVNTSSGRSSSTPPLRCFAFSRSGVTSLTDDVDAIARAQGTGAAAGWFKQVSGEMMGCESCFSFDRCGFGVRTKNALERANEIGLRVCWCNVRQPV